VPGNQKTLRADLRTEILGNAKNNPTPQRPPERSGSTDNNRFKCEDKLSRTSVGIECRAHSKECACQSNSHQRNGCGDRVDLAGIDADQLGGVGIFGRCSNRATESSTPKKEMQAAEQQYGNSECENSELPNCNIIGKVPALEGEVANVWCQRSGIRAVFFEKQIVDYDRETECAEQRNQLTRSQAAFENSTLQ
jgi:hypothetical protein